MLKSGYQWTWGVWVKLKTPISCKEAMRCVGRVLRHNFPIFHTRSIHFWIDICLDTCIPAVIGWSVLAEHIINVPTARFIPMRFVPMQVMGIHMRMQLDVTICSSLRLIRISLEHRQTPIRERVENFAALHFMKVMNCMWHGPRPSQPADPQVARGSRS